MLHGLTRGTGCTRMPDISSLLGSVLLSKCYRMGREKIQLWQGWCVLLKSRLQMMEIKLVFFWPACDQISNLMAIIQSSLSTAGGYTQSVSWPFQVPHLVMSDMVHLLTCSSSWRKTVTMFVVIACGQITSSSHRRL